MPPRISIGARLVADLLATAGATRVLTMALHAPQVHGFFSVPVDHLDAIKVLAEHFRSYNLGNAVVVSPDLGNAKMAAALARVLGVPVAAGSKQRLTDDTVIIDRIIGDVHNREVIVLDDEIATAGSIVELLKLLRAEGAGQISVACTHGLFTGPAIERLKQEPFDCRNRHDEHRAAAAGEPAAQHGCPVGCSAVRGGCAPDSRRRVDQQPLQRRADLRLALGLPQCKDAEDEDGQPRLDAGCR
jgi:adenine/guanine phosphoribosyltransferase-like PRPP-binding protein